MIALRANAAAATAAEADAAIVALESQEGFYFGVDAGVAGIHPLQAVVCAQPALRMRVFDDGLQCDALTPFGQALLGHAALREWRGKLGRGRGFHALDLARDFLAGFEPSADVMLVGALRFDAWRLGTRRVDKAHLATSPLESAIGTLWFGEEWLRRDADGRWSSLHFVIPAKAGIAGVEAGRGTRTPGIPASGGMTANAGVTAIGDDLPPGAYADMVRRAVDLLRTRPLDSLTLSQSYRRRVPIRAHEAFARLRAVNPAPACFFVNEGSGERLFGASPDLQLVVKGRAVSSIPVCGTVARKPGPEGEAESIRELLANEVDAAALAVCSRAMGEDLAPLCEPGSVRITHRQQPMALATVVHALDRVEGRLLDGADAWDCIAATGAPVMLTGTPRAEALRGIAELEASPRGWYGGLAVQVASNGDAAVGTILRAASVRGGIAEVRTGGDLLADSDPLREEQESRLKTRSLWRAFGVEP
jgi:anthranilate/para-aminobenzoate synthase component I